MSGSDRLLLAKLLYYVLSRDERHAIMVANLLLNKFNLPKFKDEKDFEDMKEC
jgi:hypothetical protein